MEYVQNIHGGNMLVDIFGYWPSFHDAEVIWLKLDRTSHTQERYRPTLEALIHVYEMTNEVDANGYYVLRNHTLAHLRFNGVAELYIEDFNYQNALMGLSLTDESDRQMQRVKWSVRFDSAFGVDASFQCYSVEVDSVVSCDKAGEPL